MRSRFRLTALTAAAGLVLLGLGGTAAAARSSAGAGTSQSALTPAQVTQLAAHATNREIIIYRNQLSGLPVRGADAKLRVSAANTAQAPVMAQLRQLHTKGVQG